MTPAPAITFEEAEQIGEQLHDHWEKMAGNAPIERGDMAWGDIVQFTLRTARNVVDGRVDGR